MYRRRWRGIASSLRFKRAAGCCLLRISYRLRVLQSARIARSISTLVQIEYKKGPECRLSLGSKCPPTSWVAVMNGQPLCTLKGKDIGGWTACWEGERVWPPPAHLPKAMPQPTKYFGSLDEAKAAVEKVLGE